MELTSKWFIAIYGWVFYNIFVWFIAKQRADAKKEAFNNWSFTVEHVDNWIVTSLAIIPVVLYGPEIHALSMSVTERLFGFSVQWYDIFYAGPGPFIEILYFAATKVVPVLKVNIIERFKKPQ